MPQILQWRRRNAILDLELRDEFGCTPLQGAAEFNAAATTALLINSSANLNAFKKSGFTPLLYTIHKNKAETATVLLRHGGDHKIATKAGNTILHLVANIATIPILIIPTKAPKRGLDLEARGTGGLTLAENFA